jgi:thiol:disulfide interchange protein DsbD
MKQYSVKSSQASCLLLAVALTACNGGINSSKGGASSSPTPAAISSSAQVVKVTAAPVNISQSSAADAVIALSISPGFHINANPATYSYLIATEVTANKLEGINVGAPVYPAAVKRKFQFAEQPLAVYEGEASIKLNLRAEGNAATGRKSLPINVRVQACDEEQCFPPATINTTIPVTLQ